VKKALGGTMISLAFFIGFAGIIILSCDTPTLEGQMRNAVIGVATIAFAFLFGLAGEKVGTN